MLIPLLLFTPLPVESGLFATSFSGYNQFILNSIQDAVAGMEIRLVQQLRVCVSIVIKL